MVEASMIEVHTTLGCEGLVCGTRSCDNDVRIATGSVPSFVETNLSCIERGFMAKGDVSAATEGGLPLKRALQLHE